jgi:L-lactate dehydrogenase complex protein LldG
MSGARQQLLEEIRRALPRAASERELDYQGISRRYELRGVLDADDLLALFEDRLVAYGARVFRCSESQLEQTVALALTARNKHSMVVPRNSPSHWLPPSVQFRVDENLSYYELDHAEGVLTGCALAIASTGTIVLRHTAAEGRRALTLIPDYHLSIVFANQLVETVVEGIRAMAAFGASPLTTISGPSATSDIEMTRIQGVHGPRILDVILVLSNT